MVHSGCLYRILDPKRTEWITKIQLALKKAKLAVLIKARGKLAIRPCFRMLHRGRRASSDGRRQAGLDGGPGVKLRLQKGNSSP